MRLLREVGWLSRQPQAFADRILSVAEHRSIPAGNLLFSVDGEAGGLFAITAGYVSVLIAPGPIEPFLAHIGGPGWWAGEAAYLSRSRRRAELTALCDVKAAFISVRALDEMVAENPEVLRYLSAITVSQLDSSLHAIASLSTKDLMLRLLTTLGRIAGPFGAVHGIAELPLTQADLGQLVCLSRNAVSPLLAELAGAGVIDLHYGRITIHVGRVNERLAQSIN